jgi:hypothetical protein
MLLCAPTSFVEEEAQREVLRGPALRRPSYFRAPAQAVTKPNAAPNHRMKRRA